MTSQNSYLPGKLPADALAHLLARYPITDPRVILGPAPGEDAAVIDIGNQYLIAKSDPITFATDEIGWYAVNVNANDVAAAGGTPAWFLATLLLPEGKALPATVDAIFEQIHNACDRLNISLVGGHTEITFGIDRPVVAGMMLGLASKSNLIRTGGAQPGDQLLVTKGIPVEATAIISREKESSLKGKFDQAFIEHCANFLHDPGISVVQDAAIATDAGRVHAMHDPTEGGIATGLWEMADASQKRLVVNLDEIVIEEGAALCQAAGLDPLGAIASGALLLAVHPEDFEAIEMALHTADIPAYRVGYVEEGQSSVIIEATGQSLVRPARDEIIRLFE